jgi:hypothetical protein
MPTGEREREGEMGLVSKLDPRRSSAMVVVNEDMAEQRIDGATVTGVDGGGASKRGERERGRGSERGEWKTTAELYRSYRLRTGAERPGAEEGAASSGHHHGHKGGELYRQKRRREGEVKVGLITSIEGSGRSEGGEGRAGAVGGACINGEAEQREVEGGPDRWDPPISEREGGEWERMGPR